MRVLKIEGSTVAFIFDHSSQDKPSIGDNYLVREAGSDDGLVVQVIAFESFDYPSLSEVLLRRMMEDSYGEGAVTRELVEDSLANPDNFALCQAKIRRRVSGESWRQWDGWIPSRNVLVEKLPGDIVLEHCGMVNPHNPLHIGKTSDGHVVAVEGRTLEKVNVITAMKGMGKSHLAKVLLLQLQGRGMPVVVFDVNSEYLRLPTLKVVDGEVEAPGIVPLKAGRNFRVSVEAFGKRALLALFNSLSPTETTANQFESKATEVFDQLERWDLDHKSDTEKSARPFLTLQSFRDKFPLTTGQQYVAQAVHDRLDIMESMQLFAKTPKDGRSFELVYEYVSRMGGTIVVDLATLGTRNTRTHFVRATIDILERLIQGGSKLPFVFFEEAHQYADSAAIENLVTRARHLGITSTFVTNMVTHLDESVVRQADNIFMLYLPHKDDVRHLSKSATVDEETVVAFAQRLEKGQALVIGNASRNYPVVFTVDRPEKVDMAGETRYAFSLPEDTPAQPDTQRDLVAAIVSTAS